MIREDHRKPGDASRLAVVMTDSFMSGWGLAESGLSYAAWTCESEDYDALLAWVRSRSDARRVRTITDIETYRPRGCAHLSIYSNPLKSRCYQPDETLGANDIEINGSRYIPVIHGGE